MKPKLLSMKSLMTGVKGVVVSLIAAIPAAVINFVLVFGLGLIAPALMIVGTLIAFVIWLMLWGYVWNRLPAFG